MEIEVCRMDNTTERDFLDNQRRIAKRWAPQEVIDRVSANQLNMKIYKNFVKIPQSKNRS